MSSGDKAHPWPALACVGALLLAGLATPLWFLDYDEAVYAAVARGMFEAGDWIRPSWNGLPFYEKPALFYWLTGLGYGLFGVTPLAPRLVSAVATLAGLTFFAWEAKRRFGPRVSEAAVWVAGASLLPMILGRIGLLDALLTAEVGIALLAFLRGLEVGQEGWSGRWLAVGYAATGAALATKGPVFPVLICGVLLLHALLGGEVRTSLRRAGLAWGIPLVLVVGAPWYLLAYLADGPGVLRELLGRHTIGRAMAPMQGHSGPLWYYLPILLSALLPFPAFLPRAFGLLRNEENESRRFARFLTVWAGLFLVVISVAATKLPSYVAPLLPALALLAALDLCRRNGATNRTAWHVTLGAGLLLATAIVVAPYLVERIVNLQDAELHKRAPALACWPPAPWNGPGLAACATILGLGVVGAWLLARREKVLWGIRVLGVAGAICWTGIWLALGGIVQTTSIAPLVKLSAEAARALPAGAPLHLVELNHRVTANLATGRRIVFLRARTDHDRGRLRELLTGADPVRVIVPKAWWVEIHRAAGGRELGEACGLVLLGNADSPEKSPAAASGEGPVARP